MNSVLQAKPPRRIQRDEALCRILVFRPVAIKLLSLLTKADPDILEVADLIASDPGFAAELLTISNSAAFSLHSRVNTIHKAVMILGTERTRRLVARTALHGMVRGMEDDACVQNCWVHSRASAALAAWLAPQYQLHPDRAYTAALMHDIGRLGLLSAHRSRYAELLERVSGTNETLMEAERFLFSMDHCEAGEWLTKTCGLPIEFQEAAGTHHGAVEGVPRDGNDLVACACAIAQALGFRAAPLVECASLEELLERVPAGNHLMTQFSATDLAHFVGKELEI
ncbi:MAG TPA: HDOD domain-containing protein [Bryobacteraceae bacterium]|nr:HDOD domain-containing protein [Bryobacteraceae bacterium]